MWQRRTVFSQLQFSCVILLTKSFQVDISSTNYYGKLVLYIPYLK